MRASLKVNNIVTKSLGKNIIRQTGTFSIPSHLDEAIDLVLGLSEFTQSVGTLKKQKINKKRSEETLVSIGMIYYYI
jgi:hypothetical protein